MSQLEPDQTEDTIIVNKSKLQARLTTNLEMSNHNDLMGQID